MANVSMNVKVVNVVKTTAEWAAVSDVITKGVLCVETTDDDKVKIKIGDGVKAFSALPYASEVDLSDYSTTDEMNTAIADAISALGNVLRIKGVVATVDELPASDNNVGDVYFVGTDGDTKDNFAEYVWTESNKWEYVGQIQTTDLSNYYDKTEVDNLLDKKVDVVDGKTLTSNDFTDELKAKLDGIEENANKYELPTAAKDVLGGVKTTSEVVDVSTGYTAVPIVDGVPYYKNEVGTTVDDVLSDDSTNPVQNKVIKTELDTITAELDAKVDTTDTLILNCTL